MATKSEADRPPLPSELDVLVVGAGFGGLYALHKFRAMGLAVKLVEAGRGVGGTWYWNRYPGARCDVESLAYSYSFSRELELEWDWSERYATQPEILRYANYVADRFDLRRDIHFETRLSAAHWDEAVGRWRLRLSTGQELRTQFCVMATGCLSAANTPGFPGLATFAGRVVHTGQWPEQGVELAGERVAIIGTGSSAVQSIPIIAAEAAHLTVFQRTPNYSMPASNAPLDPSYQAEVKASYAEFRKPYAGGDFGLDFDPNANLWSAATPEQRREEFERRWAAGGLGLVGAFADVFTSPEANDAVCEFIREKIHQTVKDPAVADLLSPHTYIGCKRPCADTGYFETFNRANVTLVDISRSGIDEITPRGVCANGREYAADVLVLATGFDAMTGALFRVDIRGRGGVPLRDKWAEGPRTLLGLATAGFPNLFTITGPGSPSVLANMIMGIEQHVDWLADCFAYLRAHAYGSIEAERDAEDAWVAHVNEIAGRTIYPTCNSWYLGANIPGKPRVFMPYLGFPRYVAKCNDVAARGYAGFLLRA